MNTTSTQGSIGMVKKATTFGLIGLFAHFFISLWLHDQYGIKHALLWWVAVMLGFTFFRSGYGFTRAWRNLVIGNTTVGARAHLLWIGLASLLMFPVYQLGWFDAKVYDIMRPIGLMMLTGAFMFGIGMQVAGSCTSGSMYRSGSGQVRLWFSILGILLGAFFATKQYGNWIGLPTYWIYSYQREFHWAVAILIQITILSVLWLILLRLENRWQNNAVTSIFAKDNPRSSLAGVGHSKDVEVASFQGWKHALLERWSLGTGSIILAALSFAALILLNRPWVISLAFPLWSAKIASTLGLEYDFEFWDYWGIPQNEAILSLGLFEDVTSIMNFGFILGATWATICLIKHHSNSTAFVQEPAGKRLFYRPLITFCGGVLMGYGAIIGLGCNIGGFLAAVLSGSIHGWAWVIAALCGTAAGVGLRKVLRI